MSLPMPAMDRLSTSLTIEEQIKARAYELYVQRGNESGSELDDWLQAEDEVLRAQEERLNEK